MCCESSPRALVGATLLLTAVAAVGISACGKKGDPLPPIRLVPATTTNLTVAQRGRELVVAFPYPRATATGTALPELDQISLWQMTLTLPPGPAGVAPPSVAPPDPRQFTLQAQAVERLDAAGIGAAVQGDRIVLRRPMPAATTEGTRQALVFAVKSRLRDGEESAFSNLAVAEVRAAPPAPRGLAANGEAEGVRVRWETPAPPGGPTWVGFNLYRRDATSRAYGAPLATLTTELEYLDRSAPLGARMIYTVTTVATREPLLVESGLEAEIEVDHRDRYPPPGPRGLVALAEVGRVRLIWDPVTAADLGGYLVYRRDPGSEEFRKVAGPVEKPEFEQGDLLAGETYIYRVTAVDRAGNESEPSGPAAGRIR